MLCEILSVWLEVIKTLNLATLLPVNSGPQEYDCLEVMDEVFSSWSDLMGQSISHPVVEYFMDGSLCPVWHTFCQICSSDSGCSH
jgi:hypothetical protein